MLAYKIARYLQNSYDSFSVLVSGYCKSAGTLLAIGASELIFTAYGELGPLDIQLAKADQLAGLESGLNISEAFSALEKRARDTYQQLIADITVASNGVVAFPTAAHAASEMVSSLYGPIFGRMDPEEVGSRYRAMRIGADYGARLNVKGQNLKDGALDNLARTYSSHGFVIDRVEALDLFHNVRTPTKSEQEIVERLGHLARHPGEAFFLKKIENSDKVSSVKSKASTRKTAKKKSKRPAKKTNGQTSKGAGSES